MAKTKSGLENSRGQRLHNFSVQSAPLLDCPWGQKVSTYTQVDSVSFQILAIISHPPSTFVSCLTLMFSWPPLKYLGASVRPSKASSFLSLSAQGKCPEVEFIHLPVSHIEQEIQKLDPWLQSQKCWGEVLITPIDLLAVLLLVQPRMLLPFFAARTHCWLTVTLPSTSTCTSFPAELLQSCSTTANQVPACMNSGTLPSQLSHLTFLYFDFHMAPAGPFLQSAWSLWMATLPSSISISPMVWFHLQTWWQCTPFTSSRLLKKWESYLQSNL